MLKRFLVMRSCRAPRTRLQRLMIRITCLTHSSSGSLLSRYVYWPVLPAIELNRYQDEQTQAVIPDTYHLNHFLGNRYLQTVIPHGKPVVEFTSYLNGNTVIPAPDPHLISLHAVCAGIFNMSGVTDYLEEHCRDTEKIAVMTAPGAAYELARALRGLQVASASTS